MALETTIWDIADHLTGTEAIFYFLEAALEELDDYPGLALGDVIRARGGVEKLSAEIGVPIEILERVGQDGIAADRETVVKVMEAFRPLSEKSP